MSKSRHNNKWFDADDYEYESKDVYTYGKKKNKYDEIALRREQKYKAKANTFAKDNDDWD